MDHVQSAGILLAHPLDQHVLELLSIDGLEQSSKRALAGHIALTAGCGAMTTTQLSTLTVIEAVGKFSNRVRAFATGRYGQGDQTQQRGQLMSFALGLARIGQPVPKTMPQRE